MGHRIEQVFSGLKEPRLIIQETNGMLTTRMRRREWNPDGIDFMALDWDNLILLDACRADVFEEVNPFEGDLSTKKSRASHTLGFLRSNFGGGIFHDTVYVTANPQLYRVNNGVSDKPPIDVELHAQIDVWQDNWDDELKTVKPSVTTEKAIEAHNEFPNKRLIIHYIQPHAPFLGPTAREHLDENTLDFDWRSKDVSKDILWKAYQETLEIALDSVSELVRELDGKTVISADHGQAFGERASPIPVKIYGHPPRHYIDSLVEVPWFEMPFSDRKEIYAEGLVKRQELDVEADIVNDRLEALGYR